MPDFTSLDGKLTFENANTTPFMYDYNPANVTQPKLRDGFLEIAVWSGETGPESIYSIFFDDFEDITAPAGWNITGIVDRSTGTPRYGIASCRLRDTPSNMTRTRSTAGFSNINVSFGMGSQMSGGVYFTAEWSPDGGNTWNLLKRINSGDPEDDNDLHQFSYPLPASADNNPAFTLRFGLGGPVNPGDKGFVDDILVGGIPY